MLAATEGADVVIHLAANTGVGPSVENPRMDCETNVTGTLNALEAARAAGAGRFVFASSGAPLGVQTPPLHEEMAPHPASPYGASKLAGEGYCSAWFHSFGVETVVLRFGNVYGEGSTRKASVVAKFIKRALAGEVLEIYGDGSPDQGLHPHLGPGPGGQGRGDGARHRRRMLPDRHRRRDDRGRDHRTPGRRHDGGGHGAPPGRQRRDPHRRRRPQLLRHVQGGADAGAGRPRRTWTTDCAAPCGSSWRGRRPRNELREEGRASS